MYESGAGCCDVVDEEYDEADDNSSTTDSPHYLIHKNDRNNKISDPTSRFESAVHLCVTSPEETFGTYAPHLRITPPSRRQSTASSALDPGYFSFPASRRQSNVSPQYSSDYDHDTIVQSAVRLSVPPTSQGRRKSTSSKNKASTAVSPCSLSSSPPLSERSVATSPSLPIHHQQSKNRDKDAKSYQSSRRQSIDPGYFSTPVSRRTSAVSPTSTGFARRTSPPIESIQSSYSPNLFLSASPSHYYRPVSPTLKEAKKFGGSSGRRLPSPSSPRNESRKEYHSSTSRRSSSYICPTFENDFPSQLATRRSSAISASKDYYQAPAISASMATSRRPSKHSPLMVEINPTNTSSFHLSPSFFDEHSLTPSKSYLLSPSSAEYGGYHSTPITRRPSAVSPTNIKPLNYSSPATRRQSFLPPSSLHIPQEGNSNLRRPSAPAILCKHDSKKKLLFPDSPCTSPEPRIYLYPSQHIEAPGSLSPHMGRHSRRSSVTSPQPFIQSTSSSRSAVKNQRRQSEPFVQDISSSPQFRHRTNSTHSPSVQRTSATSRIRTASTSNLIFPSSRPRLRSLSSVTEKINLSPESPMAAQDTTEEVFNIREVEVTLARDRKLGLSIRGGAEYDMGIYISYIDSGSAAEDVHLNVGDQIVRVEGTSFLDIPHDEAVDILKNVESRMKLVVKESNRVSSPDIVMVASSLLASQHQPSSSYSAAVMPSSQYVGQWIASCGAGADPVPLQPLPPKITISPSPSISLRSSRKSRKCEPDVDGGGVAGSSFGGIRTPTPAAEMQIIDAKARTILDATSYNKLIYYRDEYSSGNMTIDSFIAVIMELLDTPEQYTLLSDIRNIILGEHLDKFDELIYKREEQVMSNKFTKQQMMTAKSEGSTSHMKPAMSGVRSGMSKSLGGATRPQNPRTLEMLCRDPPEGEERLTGSEDSGVDLTANVNVPTNQASSSGQNMSNVHPTTSSSAASAKSRQAYMASGQHGMEISRSPKMARNRELADKSGQYKKSLSPKSSKRRLKASEGQSGANRRDFMADQPCAVGKSSEDVCSGDDVRVTSHDDVNIEDIIAGRHEDFHKRDLSRSSFAQFDLICDRKSTGRQVRRRRSSEELLLQKQQRKNLRFGQKGKNNAQLLDVDDRYREDYSYEDFDDVGDSTDEGTRRRERRQANSGSDEGGTGNNHVWRRHHSLQEGFSFIQRPRPRTKFSQLSPEEGKTRKFRVKVTKCKPTLGMVVEGGANTSQPLPRIISILEKGCAYQCRSLKVGHIIMEVDGVKLDGMSHSQCASFLSQTFSKTDKDYMELYVAEKRKTPLEMRRSSHVFQQ